MVRPTLHEQKRDHVRHNKTRKEHDLKELVMKKRECLKCETLFLSESGNNRICAKCKKIEDSSIKRSRKRRPNRSKYKNKGE